MTLARSLGAVAAGAFVVTNMIGSGIFTVPAFVRVATGTAAGSIGVWLAGALLGLCGALCYAELATRLPGAGGEYRYLSRVYGPVWGFLSGWISFVVGFSAAVAASSLGVTAYVARIGGWEASAPAFGGVGVTQGALAAALMILVLTVVHATGVHSSGRVQTTLAGMVLGAILVLVVFGLLSGRGSWSGLAAGSEPRSSWWVALLQVSYAYAGWNAAAYMAGEVRDPQRNLPRALLGGTVFVAVAYIALNVLFFYALPGDVWEADIAVGQTAATALFGQVGGVAVSALIALAMFGSVSAMTAVGPRVYFAMAGDGLAPAALARLAEGSRAPVAAIVAQGTLAAALALTGAFETLLVYIGSSLLLFSGLTVSALFVVRRRDLRRSDRRVFRTPLHPLPALVFVGLTIAAWGNGLVDAPLPTGAALATMGLGALVYAVGRRRGGLAGRSAD